eukprot:69459-Amphidinium_carterae.1
MIPRAGRPSAFNQTFDTDSWLVEVPFGALLWVRCNPSKAVKGEAKLYPAVFVGWVVLPGTSVTRDVWKLHQALEAGSFRG